MLSDYIIGNKHGCRLTAEINIYVFFNEAKLMTLSVISMSIPGTTRKYFSIFKNQTSVIVDAHVLHEHFNIIF